MRQLTAELLNVMLMREAGAREHRILPRAHKLESVWFAAEDKRATMPLTLPLSLSMYALFGRRLHVL